MFLMRRHFIVFTLSWVASSLTLTAGVSRSAPPQAEEQRSAAAKESNSRAETKETTPPKKIVSDPDEEPFERSQRGFKGLGKRFLVDQEQIWTSPAKIRFSDAQWLVPLSGITAGLFVTDADYSRQLSHNPTTIGNYSTASNVGIGALVGGAGGMWLLGQIKHNEHWSETGFLSGEAALNSLVAVESFKYSLQRERPYQGNGSGPFFQSGGTSFPSEHAAAAWSVAGVIAHEYPSPFMKVMAYGLASVVSFSRVRARQHFPSDVLVGSVIGNLVAQDIYSRHHDPALGGGEWRSIGEFVRGDGNLSPANQGSPYVPLDSWVYAAFDRLIATGYANSAMLGQRPWTRLECVRLLNESSEVLAARGEGGTTERLVDELRAEFRDQFESPGGGDNVHGRVESIYTRFTGISGSPLTDPYHFGETLINDFGRPYQEGFNNVTGFSGWATAGRWVFYARGEYQHSPGGPAYSEAVRNFIAAADENPVLPGSPIAEQNQLRALDVYAGLSLSNWQVSYGQESMSWGPGRMGSLLFSDDAAPIRMFRINRVSPFQLPWLFRRLGPVRMDAYFGNLAGHNFPPNAFFHGEKISFKPTPNLELGFSRTVVLGGVGRPLTPHAIWISYVSTSSPFVETAQNDPGKQTGGFDFSYRVPYLRNWLTLYCDSLSDDDPSPLAAPRRAGINPGIYLPQLPGLRNLDLRVEAAYTDITMEGQIPGKFIYWDGFYHDSYTNKGHLLGNWVGRDGKGYQAWSRYSLSARNFVEVGYRHGQVSPQFVPGGGTINDGSIRADFLIHRQWSVSASVQYEQWRFPILATGPQTNVTSSVAVTFLPISWKK
jgi:membrane-associated phospholipid phosphatase